MLDYLKENWAVILPLVLGLLAIFFPQIKPLLNLFTKVKPVAMNANGDVAVDIVPVVVAAQTVIDYMDAQGNLEGADAARRAAQAIFETTITKA